ncbi:hypothetical protein OTU49_011308 [Cherax quadricarinatus]|uniref:Protein kinase domain-containing protein n=1 Tax=Cherax quadricarinatus TaxID=27406 RepID=A0AAW0W6K2_CHEQU
MDVHLPNVCILETPEGLQTTLIDFGFAQEIKETTSVGTLQNTIKSSLPEMSPTVRNTTVTSKSEDVVFLAHICKNLVSDYSLKLPGELNMWYENALEERMGIGELVNIMEKLQEKEPSPSPAVLHGEGNLTYQPTINIPSCLR